MRVVIIGGSDAGISAALRIRKLDRTVRPTVILADQYHTIAFVAYHFSIVVR